MTKEDFIPREEKDGYHNQPCCGNCKFSVAVSEYDICCNYSVKHKRFSYSRMVDFTGICNHYQYAWEEDE